MSTRGVDHPHGIRGSRLQRPATAPPPRGAADSDIDTGTNGEPSMSSVSSAKLIRRVAQPAELFPQRFDRTAPRFCARSSACRVATSTATSGRFASDHSAISGDRLRCAITCTFTPCRATGARGSRYGRATAIELGIVRAPHPVARADAIEPDRAVAEPQLQRARRAPAQLHKRGRLLPALPDSASPPRRTPRRRRPSAARSREPRRLRSPRDPLRPAQPAPISTPRCRGARPFTTA